MARVSELTQHLADDPAFKEGHDRARSYLRIGRALRDLREGRGLTQEELAKLADVDQADISRIENGRWGKRGISYEVLDRLLPVFGLRVSRSVEPAPGIEVTPVAQEAINSMTAALSSR